MALLRGRRLLAVTLACAGALAAGCTSTLVRAEAAGASTYAASATLLPTTVDGPNLFGRTVAVSGDGSTAFVQQAQFGGRGSVFPFVKAGASWVAQGPAVSDPAGALNDEFGAGIALSQDGDTAVITGIVGLGALVFVRSAGAWAPQGPRLGCGGSSVALSGDGDTAFVGPCAFHRSGGTWTQQTLPAPSDGFGPTGFGGAAALSFDGDRALVGGYADDSYAGAVWSFQRTGSTWSQVGAKARAFGIGRFGSDVSMSDDGSVGIATGRVGSGDDAYAALNWGDTGPKVGARLTPTADPGRGVGGAQVLGSGTSAIVLGHRFTATGGVWSDEGRILPSAPLFDFDGGANSVAVSRDGNVLLVGVPGTSDSVGHAHVGQVTAFGLVPSHQLTVQVVGAGTVVGGGFSCSVSCVVHEPAGASVTLTSDATLGSWGGACSGAAACQVSMTQDRSVVATFGVAPPPAAQPTPSDARASVRLVVAARARRRVGRSGVLSLHVRCADSVRCAGTLSLRGRLPGGRTTTRLALARVWIAPGETRTVALRLSARARKFLGKPGRKLKVSVVATTSAGAPTTVWAGTLRS